MTEETTYYKVLNMFYRCSSFVSNPSFTVYYPVNEWVRPKVKGTKLLIFENHELAHCFINYGKCRGFIIVPCYARNVVKVKQLKRSTYLCSQAPITLQAFWRKRENNIKLYQNDNISYSHIAAPTGTLGASMVKCLL